LGGLFGDRFMPEPELPTTPVTQQIILKGDYKTFLGANDIKHDG
jgi:hypothetical protein